VSAKADARPTASGPRFQSPEHEPQRGKRRAGHGLLCPTNRFFWLFEGPDSLPRNSNSPIPSFSLQEKSFRLPEKSFPRQGRRKKWGFSFLLNLGVMKISQVAAQLYTVRDFCQTPDDIARALERVRAIGYESVQASGLGPIENADLLRLARENGLTICATHESVGDILDEPERVIDKLRALECQHTAIGFPSGVDLGSKEGVLLFCRRFESAAQQFVAAGMTVSHHNHHHEFRRVEGKPVLQWILDETRAVSLELDTYWVQYGGGSPVEWNRRAQGRLPLLHLKDYAVNEQNTPQFAEIGQGNLDWKPIIESAQESGCEWFIVEQDTCAGDPFDSLRVSFDYIRGELVG